MFQNGKITDFGEKLDKLSQELNVIETIHFFLQKEGINNIELGLKRDPTHPTNFKYASVPPYR